jgi:signal transduction histidine kinase
LVSCWPPPTWTAGRPGWRDGHWPTPPPWPRRAAGRPRWPHPHHQITIEVAGPLLVRVDPLPVSRILSNLLDNAATYSPWRAPIRLSAWRDGVRAVLAVHDDGPGLPPADRERVFER